MTKQATINRLKKTIARKENSAAKFAAHIITETDGSQMRVTCAGCAARGIVDVAFVAVNSPILGAEISRINREHKECAKYATETIFAETDSLAAAVTQIVGLASTCGAEELQRTINSVTKAATEFKENKTVKFENGVLIFTSRASGKRRTVTAAGCHHSCDCGGGNSYHRQLYALCAAAYRSNVIDVNFRPSAREIRLAA